MLHITIVWKYHPLLNICRWGPSCVLLCSHLNTIIVNIIFCVSIWLPRSFIHSFIHSCHYLWILFHQGRCRWNVMTKCFYWELLISHLSPEWGCSIDWPGAIDASSLRIQTLSNEHGSDGSCDHVSLKKKEKKMELLPGLFWWQSGRGGRMRWGHRPPHSYHHSDDGMMEWTGVDETPFICSVWSFRTFSPKVTYSDSYIFL